MDTKLGSNVFNRMLLNAAKYNFYRFWVIKEKPTGGGGIYPPTQISVKFWSIERNTENTMLHLYFNEESDYYKENTCENEVFRSTIGRN